METCYVYRKELSHEELLHIYETKLHENPKFSYEFEANHISIAQGFWVYPIFDASIKNLQYLTLRNGKQQSGVIDINCNMVSRDFLIRELSTKQFTMEEHAIQEYVIFNLKDVEEYEKEFINRILEKAKKSICKRHNLIYTDRANDMDISPIKDFKILDKKYMLEEIYCIDYFEKGKKKPWKSFYSTIHDDFYSLDYCKSKEFELYYKTFKRPVVYIPKDYYDLYYDLSFQVYLETTEELKYIKTSQLLSKLRKNVKFKEYTKYKDYLNQLIFYYRKKEYLREFQNPFTDFRGEIFYYYLTLKYNSLSGYKLAELVSSHVLEDNYLKLLEISARQENTLAKKTLYEYYSEPYSYSDYQLRRYS